jgi:hypothetical protein
MFGRCVCSSLGDGTALRPGFLLLLHRGVLVALPFIFVLFLPAVCFFQNMTRPFILRPSAFSHFHLDVDLFSSSNLILTLTLTVSCLCLLTFRVSISFLQDDPKPFASLYCQAALHIFVLGALRGRLSAFVLPSMLLLMSMTSPLKTCHTMVGLLVRTSEVY